MKYIVGNIRLGLDEDIGQLKDIAARKLNVNKSEITAIKTLRESVDARRKHDISLVYSVLVDVAGNHSLISGKGIEPVNDGEVLNGVRSVNNVKLLNGAEPIINVKLPNGMEPIINVKPDVQKAGTGGAIHKTDFKAVQGILPGMYKPGAIKMNNRPVIVGSGPAGLFAGLVLACGGYRPIIIERGESVGKRTEIVDKYWKTGELDPETNVQFGEGGAGTFSDGKLTTRINDRRCEMILHEFHLAGAAESILYRAKPHIGSDKLKNVVANIRDKIISNGGEIHFKTKLTSIITNNGKIKGLYVNACEIIYSDVVILAIGHSARDTFYSLFSQGVEFLQKPFSIGVRIEHPQELIDRLQYGSSAGHRKLGSAEYQLFYKTGGRTAYTFCMCPGGLVTASASEPGMIVTNGMSEFSRDRENANSAFVVSVGPEDFEGSHPLAGIEFQRLWEKAAFKAGGGNNAAPVQLLGDFMNNSRSMKLGTVKPSYTGMTNFADINNCLPHFVTEVLKESAVYFNSKLPGFGMKDALLTGVETRTSSPVRIQRDENFEATGIKGLYPCGEGAGYAGGIMSAAVDGVRIAEQIIGTYAQPV